MHLSHIRRLLSSSANFGSTTSSVGDSIGADTDIITVIGHEIRFDWVRRVLFLNPHLREGRSTGWTF